MGTAVATGTFLSPAEEVEAQWLLARRNELCAQLNQFAVSVDVRDFLTKGEKAKNVDVFDLDIGDTALKAHLASLRPESHQEASTVMRHRGGFILHSNDGATDSNV